MIQYAIFDEDRNVVEEFETLEAGLEALKEKNDGEIRPFADGYYTDHYELMQGSYSRVWRGTTLLRFKEGAEIEPLSKGRLGMILSQIPPEEVEELLVTLDSQKSFDLYDGLPDPPLTWDEESRTIIVMFYCLETEDTEDADLALSFKCSPFLC